MHRVRVIRCECEPGCDRYVWRCSCGEQPGDGVGWLDEEDALDAADKHLWAFSPLRLR